jgi:Restriction endonuclease NaeI
MYSAFVSPEPDAELQAVAEYLLSNDPAGVRTARVLRRTFDMLLDGQHTGRYRWEAGGLSDSSGSLNRYSPRHAVIVTWSAGWPPQVRRRLPGSSEINNFPRTPLLRIPSADVERIFEPGHGTKRVDMLFRLAQRRLISRVVVATVAQQEDYMKRIRGNGGSRSSLRPEGIVIFGQYDSHRRVAETLRLPVPGPGESVSVRLASMGPVRTTAPSVSLEGRRWVVAQEDDPTEMAPRLPDIGALGPSLR